MKKHKKPPLMATDTPVTRKQRLQQRLKELSDHSEQELATLMQTVEKVKSTLHAKKLSDPKQQANKRPKPD